ncbi:MAG TPA: hypothetical protein VEH80_00620 [Candidatus Bathyarchaeia archaeon]|nr:hypothetical protein [Candidatus Bathyarchaeia archaeon]
MPERELVERVLGTLNTFIGQLHAATWIGAWLVANTKDREHEHAVKYGLQITGGVIALTVRRFQDVWRWHVEGLVTAGSRGWDAADWILREAQRRDLGATANLIVAHLGEKPGAWPLSSDETLALIRRSGWNTEEEVLAWGRQALHRLVELRDAISERMESEWA